MMQLDDWYEDERRADFADQVKVYLAEIVVAAVLVIWLALSH